MSDFSRQTRIVDVAAAVMQRADGAFLLARRPPDKIWAGYWEFPGGKVEEGESPLHALRRELYEELGIEVETAYPWLTRIFTYPHATVRLNFFRVTQWRGQPQPHEGQELSWQLPLSSEGERGMVSPVLPANAPILRALQLPPLYAISNAVELGVEEFMRRLEAALRNGLRLIQVREKEMPRAELRALSQRILELARAQGARVLINSDADMAREIGADGVHLNGSQLAELDVRPENLDWCAASCHNIAELQRAGEMGLDFAVLGPVLPTRSHLGAAHLGWKMFAEIAAATTIPVYALGGLCVHDMETAWQHHAHGVALLRQAW